MNPKHTTSRPRTYTHSSGHTVTGYVVPDGVSVVVRGNSPFKRFFPKVGATPRIADDIARNIALNPFKRVTVRVRAAYQPQIWGGEMAARLNRR
jgi:hypothetical protein